MTGTLTRAPDRPAADLPLGRLEDELDRARFVRSDGREVVRFGSDTVAVLGSATLVGASVWGTLAFLTGIVGLDVLMHRSRSRRLIPSALDDLPMLVVAGITIITAGVTLNLSMYGDRLPAAVHGAPIAALAFVVFALVGRIVGYGVIRWIKSTGRVAYPSLVVGTGSVGAKLAERLLCHPEYGLAPVGFIDVAPAQRRPPAPMLGGLAEMPDVIAEQRVRYVFVAFTRMRDADLVDVLRACDRLDCEIYVVPRLYELGLDMPTSAVNLWGIPLLHLRRAPYRTHVWRAKRLLDVAVASATLLVLSPLLLVIALVLRLSNGPGVLFRQTRVGVDGRLFELVKFRTVRPGADAGPAEWSKVNEADVGAVGSFLRRSSLDELPQLWNVLRGQMSLVGPRPEQPRFVGEFASTYRGYDARTRVPAGITGWAQIHGLRGATPLEDRVEFDNYYIEHWSLWQDIKIAVRTVASMIGMRGG